MDSKQIIKPDFSAYPEVRWWLAQGYHTDETLAANVQKLHDMGFSACEVLTLTEPSIDRQLYGWGSEEFLHDMQVIAKKATALGMGFSFTSGPDWQPAIPGLSVNDEAAGQELNFTNVNLGPGESFDGELLPYAHLTLEQPDMAMLAPQVPQGPNTNVMPRPEDLKHRFVAAVAVRVTDPAKQAEIDLNAPRKLAPPMDFSGMFTPEPYETVALDGETAVDLTDVVQLKDGKVTLQYTAPADGRYTIFVFWRHGTAQVADSGVETSIVINHLDKRGPEAQAAYWDEHLLTPEMDALIKENGRVDFFQDSLEIRTQLCAGLFWCEDMLAEFQKRRGYDLTPYLPMLIHYNNRGMGPQYPGDDAPPRFLYEDDLSLYQKLLNDYHETMTDLYRENYLQPLRKWLNGHGINLRAQASYGSPWVNFEMTEQQDSLDYQETETFEMNDVIDYYRIHSGGVHMNKQNLFSCEMGAVGGRAYGISLKEYLYKLHHIYAAGMNRPIMHGYACTSGPEATTTWPGYDGIGFIFTDRWGDRHPYGEMVNGFTDYLARLQSALRMGTPKMDVGILNLMYESPKVAGDTYSEMQEALLFYKDGGALAEAGYTYEFFAPDYLRRVPSDGVHFDAGNTDYRALVLWQEEFPAGLLPTLTEVAEKGLPLVLLASAGAKDAGKGEDGAVADAFATLRTRNNVAVISSLAEVPAALRSLGVLPRVSFDKPAPLYSFYRDCEDSAVLYLTNARPDMDVQAELTVEGHWRPVRINAWDGTKTELADFRYQNGHTVFSLQLPATAAALFVLLPEDSGEHGSMDVPGSLRRTTKGLLVRVFESCRGTVTLADGSEKIFSAEVKETPALSDFELRVEDWRPGEKYEISETRMGHTTTEVAYRTRIVEHSVKLSQLKSWSVIPEIGKEVSGIGRYVTDFMLPEGLAEGDGLLLDLGTVQEMAAVYVNDEFAGYADMLDPKVDISAYVKAGANKLQINISTPLWNRLIAEGRYTEGAQTFMSGKTVAYEDYGLTSCKLVPYRDVLLS